MQDLILSKRLEAMVFSPDLLADSNWAYSFSMEQKKDIYEDAYPGGGPVAAAVGAQGGGLYRGSQPGGS